MKKTIPLYHKESDLELDQDSNVSSSTATATATATTKLLPSPLSLPTIGGVDQRHKCCTVLWIGLYAKFLFLFLFLTQINVFLLLRIIQRSPTVPGFSYLSSSNTTNVNTTTTTTTTTTTPPPRSIHDFQVYVHNEMKEHIKSDTIISWTKTNDDFFQELNLTNFLFYPNEIVRLHGRKKVEKIQSWQDMEHSFFVWETNICYAARNFVLAGGIKPHVLFTYMNENRGAFSMDVPNRTIEWDHLATHWTKWDCTDEEIWSYLDHPNTRAVFTTQHQSYSHPKVYSVPLGVSLSMKSKIVKAIHYPLKNRTQLLMINDNGWRHRSVLSQYMTEKFAKLRPDLPPLRNTYAKDVGASQRYVEELRQSKFFMTPSGLGWDCYRIWEAIYMGVIPIIEVFDRPIDGWRKTLEHLPVLWVNHYEDITPDFLEQEYINIARKEYDFHTLTKEWWIDFFYSFVEDQVPTTIRKQREKKDNDNNVMGGGGGGITQSAVSHLLRYYQDDKTTIPRILHFIYVTPGLPLQQAPIPKEVKDTVDAWQRYHPDWMVMLWDNAAMYHEFPDLVELVRPIQTMSWISNLLRYHALEKFGGVYLDVDVQPLQSIEPLRRRFTNFTACEDPASTGPVQSETNYTLIYCGVINNNVIGVPPHSPALQDVLTLAMSKTKGRLYHYPDNGGPYELQTSGPPVWSYSAKKFDFNILHPSLFYPCNWKDKSTCRIDLWKNESHVYGIHEWKMTWFKGQYNTKNKKKKTNETKLK